MKSELRGLLAVVLSVAVILLWQFVVVPKFFPAPPVAPAAQPPAEQKPATQKEGEAPFAQPGLPGLARAPSFQPGLKRQTSMERPVSEEIILENEWVKISFDTFDQMGRWELKKYTKNKMVEGGNVFVLAPLKDNFTFYLKEANFDYAPDSRPTFQIEKSSDQEARLSLHSKEATLNLHLRLAPHSYLLQMETELINSGRATLQFTPAVRWNKELSEESPQRGVLMFKTPPDRWHPIYYLDGKLKTIDEAKLLSSSASVGKIGWAGVESRYFLGSVLPVGREAPKLEEGFVSTNEGIKSYFSEMTLGPMQLLPQESWSQTFNVYGGPKEYKLLQAVGPDMEKAVGYGWTSVVAIPLLYLLQFFYSVVHNYGLAIILLTILVKILLNPINRKSLQSMKGMQELQPKIKELQKKYSGDKQRVNLEMMQLFKTHKINPMGGCLPMLLQFPIYIALYKVLWGSVELYHAPFFWIYKDLSAPDPYLITPILLGVVMMLQMKMTPSPSADPAQQKIMMVMPILFSGLMIFLPMGLTLYILVSTAMAILQQKMYQKGIRMRDVLRGKFA